jgi:hypothetical protein
MVNAYPAEVGRTVHYRTAAGRQRPAVVTAVPASLNVTVAARTANVVTLTVVNTLAPGRRVAVSMADASYNGIFTVATASGTQITYTQTAADAGTSTGTVRDVDTATLRVGHHGETYASKLRRIGSTPKNDRWTP